jgi:hypothetical protein
LFFLRKPCCYVLPANTSKIKRTTGYQLFRAAREQHGGSLSVLARRLPQRFNSRMPALTRRRYPRNARTAGTSTTEVNVELTELEILILRGLLAKPALDIPGGIVDDNMSELIDIGYISVRTVGNLFSYEITDAGRAALASGV